MNSLVLRVSVAIAAVLLSASIAAADSTVLNKKKKLGFFASLFSSGASDNPQIRPRHNVFGKDWWSSSDQVRIINGGEANIASRIRNPSDNPDPGGGSDGYGMGNLTYVAGKLVPLGGTPFKEARPADPAGGAIFDALSDKDLGIRVLPDIRDAILDHYRNHGFQPLWTQGGKLSARANPVLKLLGGAAEDGLLPANYLPPTLSGFDAATGFSSSDPQAVARLDVGVTAMALQYAHDASGGQFDPRRLSLYNDIIPEWVSPAIAVKVLAWSPFPDSYLRDLEPKHPAYAAMKSALAGLRKETGDRTFVPIARGKKVKPGQTDARVEAVRQRLASFGDVPPADGDANVLDDGVAGALKAFQTSAGLKPTGLIDNATINALNNQGGELDLQRLVLNMERLRWLPKNLGNRYVFVNQAAFETQVIDKGTELWQSRVIVGKPMTQTAVFNDEIEMVVFNPSWGVPPSIIANEYLPKLRNDPSYLDRIGFKVTLPDGKPVASSRIDWASYGSKVPFNIQQPPGRKNALGELKFLFPNAHNIYMHDTPNRELFSEDIRAFSHGCVRVQNPREFASILLGWDRAKVDSNTDSKQSQTVRLPRTVPIHITYFTAWPDKDGKIQYFEDIYGRDSAMENALTTTTMAQR